MKNELIESHVREAFLCGDPTAIISMGEMYLRINNLPSPGNMEQFLLGEPLYLGEEGSSHWGMSTEDAIRCLFDTKRTTAFIKGIASGIKEIKKQKPFEQVRVIEAGGGTGILAIAAAFAGAKVDVLEINPTTAQETARFIAALGLTDQITVINTDATTYNPQDSVDMIITECMHTGLAIEPQIQIMQHLRSYLTPEGLLIPKGVFLSYALARAQMNNNHQHTEVRNLASIDHIGPWSGKQYIDFKTARSGEITFIAEMSTVPANVVLAEMDVQVHDGILLKSGEAAFLGQPHAIELDAPKELHPSEETHAFVHYTMGGKFLHTVYPFKHGE